MNNIQIVQSKIYEIRGQRVMLDSVDVTLPEIGYTATQQRRKGEAQKYSPINKS
jgi:hypothetical protein